MSNTTPRSRPRRIKIPFIDVISVSDPDQIKMIEASGAVDRLHAFGTKAIPFWAKLFFRATRFWDPERDLWFLSLEPSNNSTYRQRYQSLHDQVELNYTREDIETIADLLEANADDETLARAMTQIVNKRFFGEDVPRPITKAATHTIQEFREMVPWKYFRAQKAQKKIMDYCEKTLDGNAHLVDIGHNIGEVMQTTSVALRRLRENPDKPVRDIFTQQALTTKVPRIATKRTRFKGLLPCPTVPRKTVLIYEIERAAAQSRDILFTFGAGGKERTCVFMDFFLKFMTELQTKLQDGATATSSTRPDAPRGVPE